MLYKHIPVEIYLARLLGERLVMRHRGVGRWAAAIETKAMRVYGRWWCRIIRHLSIFFSKDIT